MQDTVTAPLISNAAGFSPQVVIHGPPPRPRTLGRKIAAMLVELSPGAWITADFVMAVLAMAFAYLASPGAGEAARLIPHLPVGGAMLLYGFFFVISSHLLGLHDRSMQRGESQLVVKTVVASILAGGLFYGAERLLFLQETGGRILLISSLTALIALLTSRSLVWNLARHHAERICLLGDEKFLEESRDFLLSQERPVEVSLVNLADVQANGEVFVHWAKEVYLDEVVCMSDPSSKLGNSLMNCISQGIRVSNYVDFLERQYGCVPLGRIDHRWFLRMDMAALHPQYVAFKRLSDLVLASIGLVLASPFLLLAAMAIKLESRGPVFYKQVRTGLRNKPFNIYKLRSMRTDAEANGAQWAAKKDSRVTLVGKILRKTRLDEVPQFINILKGDMAFIGPRPERPEFVEQLHAQIPFYKERHLLKPGLTGWAQIHADYGGTIDGVKEKLKYDLFYVKHASLQFDLHICIRTIGAMMKGAR